jgi:hypothetical protein
VAIRRLTNNPLRGSENWSQPKSRGRRTVPLRLPKLGIRRLMKRDPAVGTSLPSYDRVTDTPGVAGLSGASQGVRTMSKARSARPGAGTKAVQDRSVNRSLKKR